MFFDVYKSLCTKINKSPSAVAAELGINKSNVSNWKNNGYTPRGDDLKKIANYFHVPVGYLLQTDAECEYSSGYGFYPPEFFWDKINSDRARFLHYYTWGNEVSVEELEQVWHISVTHPEDVPDDIFKQFVEANVRLLSFDPENGEWDIRIKENKKISPPPISEHEIVNPDIRMVARAGKKMTPEQAENVRKYAQYMYPEAFEDDKP